MLSGRRKPYTAIGIRRVPCARCGQPSVHQWQVCANANRWLGLCLRCDVMLNRLVLCWIGVPNAAMLIKRYAKLAR